MRVKRRGKVRKPFIETDRLVLSLWEPGDEYLGYVLWGNPIIASYWTTYVFTKKEIERIIHDEKDHFKNDKICLFPVFTKEDYAFVGVCGLRFFRNHYQFVIIFMPHKWHHGYGQEAGKAVIDYAFNTLKADSVIAGRSSLDDFSGYVYEKLGFKQVRNCFRTPNEYPYYAYILFK